MKKIAVYALTPQGANLGKILSEKMEGDLFLPNRIADSSGGMAFDGIMDVVSRNISIYPGHIFITASGIAVRAIAPHLQSKDQDPAVVVIDHDGRHCISLLSGHLGGANELAVNVAEITGGEAVITTATDTAGLPSIDILAKENSLVIANLEAVKNINMAILSGDLIRIFDPEDRLGLKKPADPLIRVSWVDKEEQMTGDYPGVLVTWHADPNVVQRGILVLHPKCLFAGIGCNRGTKGDEILELIFTTFTMHSLALDSLKAMSTIDAKKDEEGISDAARKLGVPLTYLTPLEINSVDVPHPSQVVEKHMGVSSVCEATALLKSGMGKLLVPKIKTRNVTLAVALEN